MAEKGHAKWGSFVDIPHAEMALHLRDRLPVPGSTMRARTMLTVSASPMRVEAAQDCPEMGPVWCQSSTSQTIAGNFERVVTSTTTNHIGGPLEATRRIEPRGQAGIESPKGNPSRPFQRVPIASTLVAGNRRAGEDGFIIWTRRAL